MGFENINNINKVETEEEKSHESMENIQAFVDEEKELITKDNIEEDKEKKDSRAKTFFKKAIIGTTIMVSLWSMGKMESSKVEASEGNTQTEQEERISILELNRRSSEAVKKLFEPIVIEKKANDENTKKNRWTNGARK